MLLLLLLPEDDKRQWVDPGSSSVSHNIHGYFLALTPNHDICDDLVCEKVGVDVNIITIIVMVEQKGLCGLVFEGDDG